MVPSKMMSFGFDSSPVPPASAGCDNTFCPLNQMKAGVAVRIKELRADPSTARRLREIGICEDQLIKLLATQANVICLVCNARLALSTPLAEMIMVEPVAKCPGA